jgi:hypothetical protein
MNEPPIILAEAEMSPKAGLGPIGLILSVAPLVALAAMWLCNPG